MKNEEVINNVVSAANEWRRWRELLNEIQNSNRNNYKIYFDNDGLWTDSEEERDEYPLDGDTDVQIAVDQNDNNYDIYCDAIKGLASALNAKYNCPYGDSWYITKGEKTLSFRDHDIANSTRNHHLTLWEVRHNGGINRQDLINAVEWISY